MKQLIESHEARELHLYIDNTSEIYFSLVVPTRKTMQRYFRRGDYSTERALVQWRRAVDRAAHIYAKTYDREGNWNKIFSVEDRKCVAAMLEDFWHTEMKLGNYET